MSAAPNVRPNLNCRFYEEKFPQLHEAVNTNVTSIGDMGAYVKLLEYNNVDGELHKYRAFYENSKIRHHGTRVRVERF